MVPQLEINSKITVQINKGLKNGFTLVTQMHTQETRYITCSEGQREILYPFQKKKNTRIFISFKHWELALKPSSSRFNITIFPIRQVHPILTLLYFQFVSQPTWFSSEANFIPFRFSYMSYKGNQVRTQIHPS